METIGIIIARLEHERDEYLNDADVACKYKEPEKAIEFKNKAAGLQKAIDIIKENNEPTSRSSI